MSYMQRRPCCCNKNNMDQKCDKVESVFEDTCQYVPNTLGAYDSCECGFDEESLFPENPMFGQSYVPWQTMDKTFTPEVGLRMGTIFPELVSPYSPGDSQRLMEYIEAANRIGEGCNK